MTIPASQMVPDLPYVVARGSAALHLRHGDHVRVMADGVMVGPGGANYGDRWQVYQLSVDLDAGGLLELRAQIIADAERRVADIDKIIDEGV